ncbi:hypothetical protein MXD62_16870 [Frankia sp. Mgl5]|uniref:hypothetical protein n=1 Tax=Frankia sp. Mgl5 TaxID=2933793 RepID=UPI00201014A1|nr:hypothetical protein [Frankia sp. Mgl5]MCK9928830.1 hypothetical protein [Frankia sp. Mgl5]
MRDVTYESHGVPLEEYQLTRKDHREQQSSEDAGRWAKKIIAEKKAEEAADPVLKAHRDEVARRAWKMITSRKTPDHELMRWRVRLYCGHIVETRRHAESARPTFAGASSMQCPECGKDPSYIVAFEPLGLLAEPPKPRKPAPAPTPRPPTRAQLERRLAELEAEVSELRRQAAASGSGDP